MPPSWLTQLGLGADPLYGFRHFSGSKVAYLAWTTELAQISTCNRLHHSCKRKTQASMLSILVREHFRPLCVMLCFPLL